jgi:hypothetical protein
MTKKSKPKSPVLPAASAEQDAALDKVVEDIRRGERVQAKSSLIHEAYIGRMVAQVMDTAGYGESGVERLAVKLVRSVSSLYRLKDRVEAFNEIALQEATKLAQEHRFLLTGSLFDELVRADALERDVLLRSAISNHWSVRDLRRELDGEPQQPPPSGIKTLRASTIIARSESLLQALGTVSNSDTGALSVGERDRTVAVLIELSSAINDAIRGLGVAGRMAL